MRIAYRFTGILGLTLSVNDSIWNTEYVRSGLFIECCPVCFQYYPTLNGIIVYRGPSVLPSFDPPGNLGRSIFLSPIL